MQMLIPTNMYLWYLEALFIDFVIVYVLFTYVKNIWMINMIAFAFYLVAQFLGKVTVATELFGNPLRYLFWFTFGMSLNKIGNMFKNKFRGGGTASCSALGFWLFWIRIPSTFGLACKRFIFSKCGNFNCVDGL